MRKYLHENSLVRYTANTIIDSDLYSAELENVRKKGYATDDEEYISGVRAIAASIKRYGAYTPALWVVGFKASMSDKKLDPIIKQTKAAADKITKKLSIQT